MELSLQDVKIHHKLCRETLAFSALLLVDEVPFARVNNYGNGGSHSFIPVNDDAYNYHEIRKQINEIENYLSKEPKWYDRENGGYLDYNLEIAINDMVIAKYESFTEI